VTGGDTGGVRSPAALVALIGGPRDRVLPGVGYPTALFTSLPAERGAVAAMLLRRARPRFVYRSRARVGHTDGVRTGANRLTGEVV
jgi:hypothetical protein